MKEETESFYPSNRTQWRAWLQENHDRKQSVWLIFDKMKTGIRALSWSEAVDEALCYGWIDSKSQSIDKEKYRQFFCQRKPNSVWSKINKEKILKLIEEGKMTKAGLASIELAKQNGSWTLLDEVEELTIPEDLEAAFNTQPDAKDFFLGLSKSVKKMMLHWITFAKQPATRQKRISEIVTLAAEKKKPKQF